MLNRVSNENQIAVINWIDKKILGRINNRFNELSVEEKEDADNNLETFTRMAIYKAIIAIDYVSGVIAQCQKDNFPETCGQWRQCINEFGLLPNDMIQIKRAMVALGWHVELKQW